MAAKKTRRKKASQKPTRRPARKVAKKKVSPRKRKVAKKKVAPKKRKVAKKRAAPKKRKAARKSPPKRKAATKTPARGTALKFQKAQAKKPAKPAKKPRPWAPKHFGLHQEVELPQLDETAPRDEVWEIFRTYDRDNSGAIDRGELARLLEALGQTPNEEELAVALDVVDSDHSGKISWTEFSAFWRAR
jgi:hypothetical protein